MEDQTKLTLATAVLGGYVLGRTKKGRLALTVATLVAGRGLGYGPRQLAAEGARRLGDVPQIAGLQDQFRDQGVEAARGALSAVADRGMGSLADAISGRATALISKDDGADEDDESDEDAAENEAEEPDEGEEAEGEDTEPEDDASEEEPEDDESEPEGEASEEEPEDDESEPEEEPPSARRRRGSERRGKRPAPKKKAPAKKAPAKPAAKKTAAPAKRTAKKTASARSSRRR
ncbi:histone protein [Streptomyces sp. NBC_01498]|uniref:histone protein n=1 Tax=Streptomyces sp. NBC_01498 TaxID=2975870 RepID=UPI002E7B9169|nr:histone protein [Streptomyces sp. NBC_01498]WTL27675.1 histone protein [Streptomyces sp. NBC_01498]